MMKLKDEERWKRYVADASQDEYGDHACRVLGTRGRLTHVVERINTPGAVTDPSDLSGKAVHIA